MKTTQKKDSRMLWREVLQGQQVRIARRLNRYTARWPPAAWKIALLLFTMLCSAACLWLMLHNWL